MPPAPPCFCSLYSPSPSQCLLDSCLNGGLSYFLLCRAQSQECPPSACCCVSPALQFVLSIALAGVVATSKAMSTIPWQYCVVVRCPGFVNLLIVLLPPDGIYSQGLTVTRRWPLHSPTSWHECSCCGVHARPSYIGGLICPLLFPFIPFLAHACVVSDRVALLAYRVLCCTR